MDPTRQRGYSLVTWAQHAAEGWPVKSVPGGQSLLNASDVLAEETWKVDYCRKAAHCNLGGCHHSGSFYMRLSPRRLSLVLGSG